jgi:DNA repair exonuclease SbcCD ATPase subunit
MTQINLKSVSGTGFLAFYDLFEFFVSNYEGKALQIDGLNKSDEMAQSNGAGKSGLIEAIGWGWYGELSRRNRYKDEVIYNRNGLKAKDAVVETEFEEGNNHYKTNRRIEWKKSPELSIWENDEEILKDATYGVKQEHLEKILGMNFTAFQCSQIFGGATSNFLCFPELKPADRAKVLTDIRGLEKYVLASKACAEEVKEIQRIIDEREGELTSLEGRIAQLRGMDYKKQIQEFEEIRKKKLEEFVTQEETIKGQLKEFEKKQDFNIRILESLISDYEKEIEQRDEEIKKFDKLEKEYKGVLKKEAEASANYKTLVRDFSNIQQELDSIRKLKAGTCPTCKQKITGEHLEKEVENINKKSAELSRQIKASNFKHDEYIKEMNKMEAELVRQNKLKVENQKTQNLIHEAKTNVLRLQKSPEAERYRSALENLKSLSTAQKTAKNPYEKQEEDRKAAVFQFVAQTKEKKQEIEALNTDIRYQEFWVEGFKKIRMSLFSTMIDRFQSYAQDLLSQYSSELQIEFSTERETRSGTMKDEFNISVTDSSGTKMSYEMYSGGERQKVKLSIARALGAMIRDDCGKDFNFVAFDEPNDALDNVGKEINFEVLSKLAEDGKVVLVTDHDALFKDKFDASILVVKDHDKAYIMENE